LELAKKIHAHTHLPAKDVSRLISASILPATLSAPELEEIKALSSACAVCQRTGEPVPHPKVSLVRPLRGWNEKVVADIFYLTDVAGKAPLLHVRDSATGYSETAVLPTRDKNILLSFLMTTWFHKHGNPRLFSADSEFLDVAPHIELMGITYLRAPARRHQAIGVVETRHRVLRRIISRLPMFQHGAEISLHERLSHATFLSNILLGGKRLSSFELARGYFPSLLGLPCRGVSEVMFDLHQDASMRRAVHLFLQSASRSTLTQASLPRGTPVYYFVKAGAGHGSWKQGFVQSCVEGEPLACVQDHLGRGATRLIALQDLRLVPKSALAAELESIALTTAQDLPSGDLEPAAPSEISSRVPAMLATAQTSHPHLGAAPRFRPHYHVQKDIGAFPSNDPTCQMSRLPNLDQVCLAGLYRSTQGRSLTRAEVSGIPPQVVDAAIMNEKQNYEGAVERVPWNQVPAGANVITAHDFFVVKADDPTPGAFRLKNRAVIHGNRDRERLEVPSDAEVAGLLCVRVLLLFASLRHWHLRHVDIKGAFMQSHDFDRSVYVIPPRSWEEQAIWRLIKPVYGLVDSCRAWQRTLDEFLLSYGLCRIHPIFPQLFVFRTHSKLISLIVCVVVDDLLVTGMAEAIEAFVGSVARRFTVGKLSNHGEMVTFAGGQINQVWSSSGILESTSLSMTHKLTVVEPLAIARDRRKAFNSCASPAEARSYRRLAGQLSYIGMAVLPPASYVASWMQQKLGDLRVSHCLEANRLLKQLRSLPCFIRFLPLPGGAEPLKLLTMVDASHSSRSAYGQTGALTFLFPSPSGPILPVAWISHKQRRVSSSSYGAEVLAAEAGCALTLSLAAGLELLFDDGIPSVVLTDSRGLWTALQSLGRSVPFRLMASTALIQEHVDRGAIHRLLWIQGKNNLAESLTKSSRFAELQPVLARNVLSDDLCADFQAALGESQ
jgi:hypothetical protein